MKTILALLALVCFSCATVGPIAVKCGPAAVQIAAADYTEISTDVKTKNWTDLAAVGERIGYAILDCVLGDVAAKDPTSKDNVDEFRQLHAVEFRAAGAR